MSEQIASKEVWKEKPVIECSICHVLNEDSARFCAECGQRIALAAQDSATEENLQAEANVLPEQPGSQDVLPVPPPSSVLDSPMAQPAASDANQPPANQPASPEFKPAQEMPPPAPTIAHEPTPGQTFGQSPDLAPEPQAPQPFPSAPKPTPPKLHSPLLQGDDILEEDFGFVDYSSLRKDRTPFPHRSHIELPESKPEPEVPGTPKDTGKPGLHLRSPLLGGGDEPDFPPPPTTKPSRPGHLRSPLLGGDFEDEDEYLPEDESTPSTPGALRSPLLQSKSPRSAAPQPRGESDFGSASPPISPDKARILKKLEKSKYGQEETTSPPQPIAQQPIAPPPEAFPNSTMGSPAASMPPNFAASPILEPSQPLTPPQASFEPPVPPPNAAQPYLTQTPTSLPVQQPTPPTSPPPAPSSSWNLEPAKFPETSGSFGRTPETPPEAPRLRSKMLSGGDYMEPSANEPISRRVGTSDIPKESENAGAIRFFVMLLYASVLMKLWLMFDYIKAGYATPSFIADQVGQLAVIFFLIFIGSIYSKPSS